MKSDLTQDSIWIATEGNCTPPAYVLTQKGSTTVLQLTDDCRLNHNDAIDKIMAEVIQTTTGGTLIIDMKDCIAPCSNLIALIIRLNKQMRQYCTGVTLTNVRTELLQVLTILKITTLFTIQLKEQNPIAPLV